MDECQTGAAYSQTGRRKVVHMRRPWDAPKDFNLVSIKNFLPHFEISFWVLANHFKSSLITVPNRFTSLTRVKSSSPIFRVLPLSADLLNLNFVSVHFLVLTDILLVEAHSDTCLRASYNKVPCPGW